MESIPRMELSSLVEDIHVKTQEASQNTDLDMREFSGIDKFLQGIFELLNNALKLTKINERINKERKKLKEVENDPTFSEDRLYDLNIEKQARLEILSQNQKDLQTEAARIKQNLERFLIKMHLWQKESVHYFFEQGITIISVLTALSMTIR